MEKNYKIGFSTPPDKTKFQKGKSANPNGRPKRIDREFSEISTQIFKLLSIGKSPNHKKQKLAKQQIKRIKEILNEKNI